MAELFASGLIVDGILALMLLEAIVSLVVAARLRRRLPVAELFFNLGAGAALLLALRAALLHAAWPAVAVWLIVALGGHVGEMSLRWTKPGSAPASG